MMAVGLYRANECNITNQQFWMLVVVLYSYKISFLQIIE